MQKRVVMRALNVKKIFRELVESLSKVNIGIFYVRNFTFDSLNQQYLTVKLYNEQDYLTRYTNTVC